MLQDDILPFVVLDEPCPLPAKWDPKVSDYTLPSHYALYSYLLCGVKCRVKKIGPVKFAVLDRPM